MDSTYADILIVDDDPDLLQLVAEKFTAHGLNITAVRDPIEALRLLQKRFYPVVVTDLQMPNLHGTELIRLAKDLSPMTTVFVTTGQANSENIVTCFRYGAADIFLKPVFTDNSLIDAVKHSLAQYRRRKEAFLEAIP